MEICGYTLKLLKMVLKKNFVYLTLYKDGASGLQPQQCTVEHSRGENLKQLQEVTHLPHSGQKKNFKKFPQNKTVVWFEQQY